MILFPKEKKKIFSNFETLSKNHQKIDNAIKSMRSAITENYKKVMDQMALRQRSVMGKISTLEQKIHLMEAYLKEEENYEAWLARMNQDHEAAKESGEIKA